MPGSKDPKSEPLLITQKEIAARYGISSRDMILALERGYNFPAPRPDHRQEAMVRAVRRGILL